jgi:antitoxin component YwqK of YwqJK toxin-antitoxin module
MKKYIIILSFLFLLISCKNHLVKEYYDTGEIKAKYYKTKDGVVEGKAIFYYKDGTIEEEAEYVMNERHGVVKKYFPNGNLKAIYNYNKGYLHNLNKVYYQNGNLNWEQEYINGFKEGIYKDYNEDGDLVSKATFLNNKLHGEVIFYFNDGSIKSISNYQGGLGNGLFKSYFEDGKLKNESIYVNDEKVYSKIFDNNSKIKLVFHRVDIMTDNDTVFVGEKINIRIKVYGPIDKNSELRVGFLDRFEKKPSNSLEKIKLNLNGEANYSSFPKSANYKFINAQYNPKGDFKFLQVNYLKLVVLPIDPTT